MHVTREDQDEKVRQILFSYKYIMDFRCMKTLSLRLDVPVSNQESLKNHNEESNLHLEVLAEA